MTLTKLRTVGLLAVTVLLSVNNAGCGSASTASSALSTTIGAIAVASPTASTSSTSFLLPNKKQSFFAKLQLKLMNWVVPQSIAGVPADKDNKPFSTMVSEMKSDLSTGTPETIAAKIGNMSVTTYQASCYGPTWTDDATGSNVSRPSGDLGMVAANASSTDTTACAAAQLNSLIGGAPQFANKLIKLQATLVAALNKNGKELPAIGASVDGLSNMPTLTGITMTEAKVTRMNNRSSDGNAVYKTSLKFTDSSSKTGTVTIYHTPTNADNTNFTGLIQAVVPHTVSSGAKRGISMVYEQKDGALIYALDTAANRSTESSDFFSSTTGRVDFSKTAFGEDGNRIIASFNSTTNATTMHYAWQAGSSDGSVRAFAVSIPAGTVGSLTGVAYFGFGAAVSSLTDSVSSPWMTKMYCNWLNGLANGTSQSVVQGQTFTQSGGKFIAATSKINFAPTDTCSKGSSFTVTSATPSDYNGSRTANPNDLVAVNSLGTIPSVTVPSYPVPAN